MSLASGSVAPAATDITAPSGSHAVKEILVEDRRPVQLGDRPRKRIDVAEIRDPVVRYRDRDRVHAGSGKSDGALMSPLDRSMPRPGGRPVAVYPSTSPMSGSVAAAR